jgi:hypothetical protein
MHRYIEEIAQMMWLWHGQFASVCTLYFLARILGLFSFFAHLDPPFFCGDQF